MNKIIQEHKLKKNSEIKQINQIIEGITEESSLNKWFHRLKSPEMANSGEISCSTRLSCCSVRCCCCCCFYWSTEEEEKRKEMTTSWKGWRRRSWWSGSGGAAEMEGKGNAEPEKKGKRKGKEKERNGPLFWKNWYIFFLITLKKISQPHKLIYTPLLKIFFTT